MADYVVAVSDPESGSTYQEEIDGPDANRFAGREIGDEVDGDPVGLPGYTVEITGGSDDTGRPMHEDVDGPVIAERLTDGGTGFNPERDGERRRITVRGREISDATRQINARVVDRGDQRIEVLLGDEEPEAEQADEAEDAAEDEDADDEAADEPDEEPEAEDSADDEGAEEADEADAGGEDADEDE
jgi:small subunit ribosomal protein S6e